MADRSRNSADVVRAVGRVSDIFGGIASGLMMLIVFLIVLGVLARYVLRSPVASLGDWAAFLMVPMVALALADTQRRRGHVAVDLLVKALTPRWQSVLFRLSLCIGMAYALVLAWAAWNLAAASWAQGLRSTTARIPLGWIQIWIVVGFALFLLQALADAISGAVSQDQQSREDV